MPEGARHGWDGLTEPIVEHGSEGLDMARSRRLSRASLRRIGRRCLVVALVLAAIPVVLTFLYLPSFVHPVSTLMLKDLATFSGYDRRWVSIDDVAPVLAHSVIMSEDGQFCFHRGVDLGELRGVVDDALAGEATRGASTITMQTVKNLFLWSRPLGSVRKVVELPLAVYFDAVMSKRRIMEIYLNIAEWGPGIYGIEAAARHHFGVSAKQLSRRQAALLAVS
ncbi:MAG: monofunctional biosynthetic peptidoglycan transglycosylase, partial [Mesorhizobium sp.]